MRETYLVLECLTFAEANNCGGLTFPRDALRLGSGQAFSWQRIMMLYRVLLILVLFGFTSCSDESSNNSVPENSEIAENQESFLDGYYEWYYADTNVLWVSANYKNNLLHGEWKEYYKNGHVKKIEHFEFNYSQGIAKHFYENGEIKIENEVIKYYEVDTPYVNTRRFFDENGEILEDSSLYYTLLNKKEVYTLNSKDSLKVTTNRLLFNDQFNVITANFDDDFNIIDNKERHFPDANNVFTIPIPTDSLGKFSMKFYINDFSYKNCPDSMPLVRRYLVDYPFTVIK